MQAGSRAGHCSLASGQSNNSASRKSEVHCLDHTSGLIKTSVVATVNVQQAKTHLSRLLALVEAGEEVVIARDGRPVARLVRVGPPARERKPGGWRHTMRLADDFDDELSPGLVTVQP